MIKWYPSFALGALLFILCSVSFHGTLNASNSADNLTEISTIITATTADNQSERNTSYFFMAADTQVINMPLDSSRKDFILDCDNTTLFQNRFEHVYPDTVAHRDTLTICTGQEDKRVLITFTEFEIAAGDTLFVYDADSIVASRQVHAFSGVGVSSTGGWVRSECNPSGCLTFQFVTNGDNRKGIGWESWVTCDSLESTQIVCPDIPSVKLDCEDTPFASFTLQRPDDFTICGELLDTFCLKVYNQGSNACVERCIGGATTTITENFGVGLYSVVWYSKHYPNYKVEKTFSVQGPTLVCNDDVSVPLGSGCALDITPDMLLENPCDTISNMLYYRISFTLNGSKGAKKFVGGGGPGIPYPYIPRDTFLKYSSANMCGSSIEVDITQLYYPVPGDVAFCTSGTQESTCSVNIHFNDETAPFFYNYNRVDTVVSCDTTGLMNALGRPIAFDNCDTASVVLDKYVLLQDDGACGGGKVIVSWRAEDLCGNRSYLNDTIYLKRPTYTSFYNPGNTILNCNEGLTYEDAILPGIVRGEIKNGVLIPMDTIPLSTEKYICGYILYKNDEQFPSDCGEKWIRSWSILDWCDQNTGLRKIGTQSVTITDTIAPTFINCPDSLDLGGASNPMVVELGHFDCAINVSPEKLGIPVAIDNCDPNPTVTMFCVEESWNGTWNKIGTNLSNSGPLACDTFRIGWIASDICHEQIKQDTCYKYVIIKDVTKPTAVCTDQINFSIGSDWARVVGVDDIDAGSWDACGIAKREISFDQITWDTVALLDCEAIHEEPKLYLRVTDLKGNENICWTVVNVKDDVHPSCGKLPNVSLFCDEFKTGDLGQSTDLNENGLFDEDEYLPLTGVMLASFNDEYGDPLTICEDNVRCAPLQMEQEYQLIDWPCGQTQIQRRYRATDWGPNSTNWETQLISLEYREAWEMTLPADWEGSCGEAFPEADLAIKFGHCDQLGWEHEDKVFEIIDDACYKVERTYHIINWCLYKAGEKPTVIFRREDDHGYADSTFTINPNQYPNVGYFTYIQILKVHSFEAPKLTINEVESCLVGQGDAGPYGEADVTPGAAPYECDDIRTFTAEAETCIPFATLDFQWCILIDGVQVDSGVGGKFPYPVQPGRTYTVQFKANDRCGNGGFIEKDYEFFDCKKPTPYCRAGLGVEMGQEGKITIWASDIDLNSFDNCTPKDSLRFRLWHTSLEEPPSTLEEVLALPSNIDFTCDNFGTQIVRLYVIDLSGNWAYCTTTVDIQDNMSVCQGTEPPVGFVSGSIQTTDNQMMNDVNVTAISGNGNTIATVTKDGVFQLSLPKNNSYTLRPEMDVNPLNGVTTFDLVLISKHILGTQQFSSPYQYIAADVNNSGTISAYDMVQLRQLILSITPTFPTNTSWQFVDAAYVFTEDNPTAENYPQSVELTDVTDLMEVSFVAVKIGDVNQTANFGESAIAESRTKTAIQVVDQQLEAGETYTIDFLAPKGSNLEGYQFTIDYSDLELVNLVEKTAKEENFGFNFKERGMLTTSWNANGAADAANNVSLFSLVLKAQSSGLLSEKLSINSNIIAAEAYDTEGNISNVQLQFMGEKPSGIQLYQNRPNPFRTETTIGFYLPEGGNANLSIMDVQGKVLKEIRGIYEKGYHEIQVNAQGLSDKGVLYYHLVMDKKQVVKRMIVVE